MPKKTKDLTENVENEVIKKSTTRKSSSSKTSKTTKEASSTTKKASTKKDDNVKASSKSATKKTTKTTLAKTSAKESKTKTSTKAAKTKTTTTRKSTTRVSNKKSSTEASKIKKVEILEYYDLPYRYNETIVKILAQTPTTLFVYWDISDEDKNNYIKNYGEYFFNNTKPVLVIHNITKNYSFEIDINDFANSWYLRVEDSNCEYKVELGRRPINNYVSISNNYLFISSSNDIKAPNDHILFESLPANVIFRNVKTNETTQRAIIHYLTKFKNSYNIKNFYKEMYQDENINFDKLTLNNPSSSSTFK